MCVCVGVCGCACVCGSVWVCVCTHVHCLPGKGYNVPMRTNLKMSTYYISL